MVIFPNLYVHRIIVKDVSATFCFKAILFVTININIRSSGSGMAGVSFNPDNFVSALDTMLRKF